MDPKSSAVTIVLGMTKPEGEVKPEEMLKEYAEGMLSAVKSGNAEEFASNLKDFITCCEAAEYED